MHDRYNNNLRVRGPLVIMIVFLQVRVICQDLAEDAYFAGYLKNDDYFARIFKEVGHPLRRTIVEYLITTTYMQLSILFQTSKCCLTFKQQTRIEIWFKLEICSIYNRHQRRSKDCQKCKLFLRYWLSWAVLKRVLTGKCISMCVIILNTHTFNYL